MTMPVIRRAVPVLAAVLLLACDRKGDAESAGAARIDTTNTEWSDGLSTEQIADSARALSPEQAAAQGLSVDTSIHLEQLGPSDSVRGDRAPVPVDSAMAAGALDILRTPQAPAPSP
ncbi:MAG TPA: hypothetical protein VNP72_10240, partial [Longimicrobium sp.]|nr:hypothetical protein [Longimicrobium sp.]